MTHSPTAVGIRASAAAFLLLAAFAGSPLAGGREEALSLNNRGIAEYNQGEYEEAIALFNDAIDLDPENDVLFSNLAITHYAYALALSGSGGMPRFDEGAVHHLREAIALEPERSDFHATLGNLFLIGGRLDEAEGELEEARSLDPEDAEIVSLLAELRYRRGDLHGAVRHWEEARELDPESGVGEAELERLLREEEVEGRFGRREGRHFTVRFDVDPKGIRSRVERMLLILDDAWRAVSREYDIRPTYEIPVVIYEEEDFISVTGVDDWARGLYDGKIRVPESALAEGGMEMERVLRHEYTHAAVHFQTGGRCPVWLNEGLAQWTAGEWSEAGARALEESVGAGSFPSLATLEGSFLDEPDGDRVRLRYAASAAAVRYLHERYGRWSITRLLRSLGEGVPFPAALEEVFALTYPDLDAEVERRIRRGEFRTPP